MPKKHRNSNSYADRAADIADTEANRQWESDPYLNFFKIWLEIYNRVILELQGSYRSLRSEN